MFIKRSKLYAVTLDCWFVIITIIIISLSFFACLSVSPSLPLLCSYIHTHACIYVFYTDASSLQNGLNIFFINYIFQDMAFIVSMVIFIQPILLILAFFYCEFTYFVLIAFRLELLHFVFAAVY